MNSLSDALLIVNEKGLIEVLNPFACELFGYKEDDLLNKSVSMILPSMLDKGDKRGLVFDYLKGDVPLFNKKGAHSNGRLFPVDLFVIPFKEDKKELYACVLRDDSEKFVQTQMESLMNALLERVMTGETMEIFASFLAQRLNAIFGLPLMSIHTRRGNEIHTLASAGENEYENPAGTILEEKDDLYQLAVKTYEEKKITALSVDGGEYQVVTFPLMNKDIVFGGWMVVLPEAYFFDEMIKWMNGIAGKIGLILEISRGQDFSKILGKALSLALSAVFITDAERKILWANDAFYRISGYTFKEVLGKDPGMLYSGEHPVDFYENMHQTLLGGKMWRGEVYNRNKAGNIFVVDEMITPILDGNNRVVHYVSVCDELVDAKQKKGQVSDLSHYDRLTGLPNRYLFQEKLKFILDKTKKTKKKVAVVTLDLMNFRRFNDVWGQAAGDFALKTMGERIVAYMPVNTFVSRLTGDEYGIILRDLNKAEDAGDIVNGLIRKIGEPLEIDGRLTSIGCRAGIAIYPDDTEDLEKLIHYADMALVKSIKTSWSSYCYFQESMNAEVDDRIELEQDMYRALKEKEFFLVYQPQFDIHTKKIVGFEALLRWNHPRRGLVPPNVFIPIAENSTLISDLCEFVLDESLTQLKKWRTDGYKELLMAVNLSPAQFGDKMLVPMVEDKLKKFKFKKVALELELTETLLMQDKEEAKALLDRLKGLGTRIAIDDFGTGYSSLSYLRHFPVDKIKIDRSFIAQMLNDKKDAEIISAIIGLGHALDLEVIAEGVEEKKQFTMLDKMGCDMIQGFLMGRPVESVAATLMLEDINGRPEK